jgi:hypothetical protein
MLLSKGQGMKRELKPEEREEIVKALAAGNRVKATSIYLSATEGNLMEAQNLVKSLTTKAAADGRVIIKTTPVDIEPK